MKKELSFDPADVDSEKIQRGKLKGTERKSERVEEMVFGRTGRFGGL